MIANFHTHTKRCQHAVGEDREYVEACDAPLEINLLGLLEGRRYPNPLFWEVAKEVGNKVILGVDAHNPERLKERDVMERGRRLAEKFGLEVIDKDILE